MDRFAPGESIVIRYVHRGKPRFVHPATAVRDDESGRLGAFWGAGWQFLGPPSYRLPRMSRAQAEASFLELETREYELSPMEWRATNVLMLAKEHEWWSRWVFWEQDTWRVLGYYVNVELPWKRTPEGFDTRDLQLDVTVVDGKWEWKDEDDFAERIARGIIDPETATRVEAERPRMIAAIEAREPPFDGSWDDWRPDPSWPVPTL